MIKRLLPFYSIFAWCWCVLVVLLALYDIRSLFFEKKIQFDLMSLLPQSHSEKMLTLNQLMDENNIAGHVVILVGHKDSHVAEKAFDEFRTQIKEAALPFQEKSVDSYIEEYKRLFKEIYPHRAGFLSDKDRELLLKGQANALTERALSEIMLPFGSTGPVQLDKDPFFLYPHYISSLKPSSHYKQSLGGHPYIEKDGKRWYIYNALLSTPAFSLKAQEELSDKLTPIFDKLEKSEGVEFLKTGAIFYAAAASKQANKEVSLMSFASIFIIILLLLFTFKTLRPLLFAITVIGSGLIVGLSACLLIFGSVHILAFVFGSSLVGVTVDYSLHYYCASFKKDSADSHHRLSVLESLMPALFLGVLSSVIGYFFLIVPPFPGVQQMAVLASVGLMSSFLTVCFLGPYFIKLNSSGIPTVAGGMQNYLNKLALKGEKKYIKFSLIFVLIGLFITGFSYLTFEDDFRNFQSLDQSLKKEEEKITSMVQTDAVPKFLIIKKQSMEEFLRTAERVTDELVLLKSKGVISSQRSLSMMIPSQQKQQENQKLVIEKLYEVEGPKLAKAIGLKNIENNFGSYFQLTKDNLNLLPTNWRDLVTINDDGTVEGRIFVFGVKDTQIIADLSAQFKDVMYIDPPLEYSSLFTNYRHIMVWILLSVIGGLALFLTVWKGFRKAFLILSPVTLSILATIGMIGILGHSFSLFHAMGLLLVLSIGIDYAFFLFWRVSSEKENLLLLANGLAALTTILSFGLLSFSQTSAISSFGLTVFIGITLNFCITTLFLGKERP